MRTGGKKRHQTYLSRQLWRQTWAVPVPFARHHVRLNTGWNQRMSALTFTLKIEPRQRLDLTLLIPDVLNGKSRDEIAAMLLSYGKTQLRVDEAFELSGDDSNDIVIENSSAKLDYIGSKMKTGRLTVNGNAGSYFGFQMRGGT